MIASVLLPLVFLLVVAYPHPANGKIVSEEGSIKGVSGTFRYYFDDTRAGSSACDSVVILGVGTNMKISEYSIIATEIVTGHDIVTIVADPSPNWPLKNSEESYIKLVNAIVAKLNDTVVPICKGAGSSNRKVIVGGHSASGGVAWNCLSKLSFPPAGFLGLDPYQGNPIRGTPPQVAKLDVPTLNIGFTETTCRVDVTFGARAYYNQTPGKNHRVLYLIQNPKSTDGGERITHCSFTDNGCLTCPVNETSGRLRASVVGPGIHAFVQSLVTGEYHKQDYCLPNTIPVDIYVNQEGLGGKTEPCHVGLQAALA